MNVAGQVRATRRPPEDVVEQNADEEVLRHHLHTPNRRGPNDFPQLRTGRWHTPSPNQRLRQR